MHSNPIGTIVVVCSSAMIAGPLVRVKPFSKLSLWYTGASINSRSWAHKTSGTIQVPREIHFL